MVMSSAYVVSSTDACGVGMSDVYMLIRVSDSTPPCGTQHMNWYFVSECRVCLASFGMVCDEFKDDVWDV